MIDTIHTDWLGDMVFETDAGGHKIKMDAEEQFGGQQKGPRPKLLVLSALSGCTAMDVISILRKMKVEVDAFRIHVSGDKTEEHPRRYKGIHISYEFLGKDFAGNTEILSKISHAVELSLDKYCGTAAMLKMACELTHEIRLENS